MTVELPGRIDLVIFDLDGVIYRGSEPVAGAAGLVADLRGRGVRVAFATNNSMATRDEYAQRLGAMDIPAEASEIMTSTWATALHLGRHLPQIRHLLTVGARGLVDEFEAAGFVVHPSDEGAGAAVDAVIVGLDQQFDYRRLAAAVGAVRDGALFVATSADARYPVPGGFLPGAGAMVAAVAASSGTTPLIIGKPQAAMFETILREVGTGPETGVVIGDNADADMPAAARAGLASILVLTGVTSADEAGELEGERRPSAIAADPSEVWRLLQPRLP
jgi:4-nitrophenyl phosphatase